MEVFAVHQSSIRQRVTALLTVAHHIAKFATWIVIHAPQYGWDGYLAEMSAAERETVDWLVQQVLSTGQIIIIDDLQQLPRAQSRSKESTAPYSKKLFCCYGGFPLGRASPLGVLSIATREACTFTAEQKQAIAVLADEIGNLLCSTAPDSSSLHHVADGAVATETNPTLDERLLRNSDRSLMHLSMQLQHCLTFDDLNDQLMTLLPAELPIQAFELTVILGNHNTQQLCLWPADTSPVPSQKELHCRIPLRYNQTVLDGQVSQSVSEGGTAIAPTSLGSQPQWRCYQLTAKNRSLGTLKLCLTPEAALQVPENDELFNYVAEQIGITLYRLKLLRRLQAENLQDPLTKLFNRRHMIGILDKLMQRVSYGHYQVGFIMLDLDHFKRLNDTYGHDAGDQVLRMIGLFLKGHARPNDVVCRYGGEEFALILPGLTWEILERRAKQLCRSIRYLSLTSGETPLQVTLSAGYAIAPDQAKTPSTLIKAADQALYEAKRQGRDRAVGAPFAQADTP